VKVSNPDSWPGDARKMLSKIWKPDSVLRRSFTRENLLIQNFAQVETHGHRLFNKHIAQQVKNGLQF
jgi:hypothetical protein